MKHAVLIFHLVIVISLMDSCAKKSSQKTFNQNDSTVLLVDVKPIDRNYYGARNEPENGVLHGAGQDLNGFIDYAVALGQNRYPIIYMDYVGITGSVEGVENWGITLKEELDKFPKDVMPQIGLNMTGGNDTGEGMVGLVAKGDYDAQLMAFIVALKNTGRKSYVRIGYEFEGRWNGYDPEEYVDAYIKITRELRKADIGAATVWCSAGGSAGFMPWEKLEEYYPGDEWVDWWGVDIFSPEEITDARLLDFIQKAELHKKPVMIGETTPRFVGTADGATSWNNWFRPFFELVYKTPQIKAISYINWDWAYWSDKLGFQWHNWKDGRIEKNPVVKEAYLEELQKPIFIHSSENRME